MDMRALAAVASRALRDASSYVFFDERGQVLASNAPVNTADLAMLAAVMDDRDEAVRRGMTLGGVRYEVHRHHPPLVYGRTMGLDPEISVGAALCKIDKTVTGCSCYGFMTYEMPNISARMVPILYNFCRDQFAAK